MCSWSNSGTEELFLYGEEYNGVIWDVAINQTSDLNDEIFLAGTFDTVTKTSQVQLCSVGIFDGLTVEKVCDRFESRADAALTFGVRLVRDCVHEAVYPRLHFTSRRLCWVVAAICLWAATSRRGCGTATTSRTFTTRPSSTVRRSRSANLSCN